MATLTSALDTDFTPAVGDFIAQATGGFAQLLRKNTAGAAWAVAAGNLNGAVIVSNPVTGAVYRFTNSGSTTPIVQADQ